MDSVRLDGDIPHGMVGAVGGAIVPILVGGVAATGANSANKTLKDRGRQGGTTATTQLCLYKLLTGQRYSMAFYG